MLSGKEAIIFDFDGTLADSMWIWTSIDEDYIRKYRLEKPENFHEDMEGMSYTEVARYFLDTFPQLPHTQEEIMREWSEMANEKYLSEVLLKEGVKEFLAYVKGLGIKTGIATSNAREIVMETLETMGVSEYFDSVHSACEVAAGKPSPDIYLLVAEELGVQPERCLVFEDVPMGILAGKNAGMKVCAVEDDFSRPQIEKKRTLADYYIETYYDVLNQTYEVL